MGSTSPPTGKICKNGEYSPNLSKFALIARLLVLWLGYVIKLADLTYFVLFDTVLATTCGFVCLLLLVHTIFSGVPVLVVGTFLSLLALIVCSARY
jgi:hypothetical protein